MSNEYSVKVVTVSCAASFFGDEVNREIAPLIEDGYRFKAMSDVVRSENTSQEWRGSFSMAILSQTFVFEKGSE